MHINVKTQTETEVSGSILTSNLEVEITCGHNCGFFSHAIFSFVRMHDHLATNIIITQDR